MKLKIKNVSIEEMDQNTLPVIMVPDCNMNERLFKILSSQYEDVIAIRNNEPVGSRAQTIQNETSRAVMGDFKVNSDIYNSLTINFANIVLLQDPIKRAKRVLYKLMTDPAQFGYEEFHSYPLDFVLGDGRLCTVLGLSNAQINALSGMLRRLPCGQRLDRQNII